MPAKHAERVGGDDRGEDADRAERGVHAAFHAQRRDRAGRIDAHPPFDGQPDLGPRVRVGLAHDELVVERVHLAALVAGHDARRNAGRAHEEREAAGIVLAEALLRLEEEVVIRIARIEQRRLERVGELAVEELEDLLQQLALVGGLARPLPAERDGARVARLVEAQRRLEVRWRQPVAVLVVEVRAHLVALALGHRAAVAHLQVGQRVGARREAARARRARRATSCCAARA